jgi:glutamate carboxypeptidase
MRTLNQTLQWDKDPFVNTIIDLELLEKLVNLNSQSRNTIGVQRIQKVIDGILQSFGMRTEFISNMEIDSADLLVGRLKSKSLNAPQLTLIGHADTVIGPTETNYFRREGNRLLGPGIADNKGGLFVMLKAIEIYQSLVSENHLDITFISSPNEELGATGFHQTFKNIGLNQDYLFGFEPSMEDGSIITSRNGNRWYELKVSGHTGHAGRSPKGHMNAAHDLCRKVSYFCDSAEEIDGVTVHVGSINGGHSVNVICEEASAKIDVRFGCFAGLNAMSSVVEGCLEHTKKKCSKYDAYSRTEIDIFDDCPPMASNGNGDELIASYLESIERIEGRKIQKVHSGGAADINYFSHPDAICIDGLGPVAANMHRVDEYVEEESLMTRSFAFAKMLMKLNEEYQYGKQH